MTKQEIDVLCMDHQGGYLKKKDCWYCKSKEEQKEILEKVFNDKANR